MTYEDELAETQAAAEEERAEVDEALTEDEHEFEKLMAWEGYTDRPILSQFSRITELANFAFEQFKFVEGLQEEGIPDDVAPLTLTLGSKDEQVVSLGLNLVGFISPTMAPAAKALMERIDAAIDAKEISHEARAQIVAAADNLRDKTWAAMLGMDLDTYRDEKRKAEEAEQGDTIASIDAGLDDGDGIVYN